MKILPSLLLIFVLFTLLAYQIPSSNPIDSLVKSRDKNFIDESYELAYNKTIRIADYYKQHQEWNLVIENLYLGIIYSEYFDYSKREPLIYKAFQLATQHLNDDNVNKAAIYACYGEILIEQNKYDSAAYYLEAALQPFLVTAGWEVDITTTQYLLAQISYSKEEYDQAIQYLLKTETLAKEFNNSNGILDLVYTLLGAVYYEQQDLENAIYATKKSVQLIKDTEYISYDDSLSLMGVYQNLGVFYQIINDYKRSKLYFETTLEYQKLLNGPKNEMINVILNYGILLAQTGLFQDAIIQLQKALVINNTYSQNGDVDLVNKTSINLNLSYSYANLNLLDSAFFCINQALSDAQKMNNLEKIASFSIRKGKLFYQKKEYERAQRLILKAISNMNSDESADIIIDLHHAYNTLGKIYHEQGDYSTALQYFQKALINNTPDLTNNNDDIQQIKKAYQIDHLIETLENKTLTLEAIATPKSLELAHEHYQATLEWIEQTRQNFAFDVSKVNLNKKTYQIYKNALATAHQLYQITKEDKYLESAFNIVEKQKSILLLENMIDEQGMSALGVPQHLLERESNLKTKLAYYQQKILEVEDDATVTTLYQGYLDEYELAFANLKDSLSELHKDYFNLEYQAAIADISTVQNKLLDDNGAFIQFSALDSAWLVFVIDENDKKMLTIPFGEKEQDQLDNLMSNLSSNSFLVKGNNALTDFSEASYQVFQSLFEPIINKLSPNVQSLTIAGDGPLNFLPFEVLLKSAIGADDRSFIELPYLIKDYSFHYGYSASLLQQNRNTFEALQSNQRLLAFAPLYENSQGQPLASRGSLENLRSNVSVLSGTPKEVKAISTYFDGHFDISAKATESAFKTKVKGYGLLHLAMHGQADKSSANLAHLIFADHETDSLNDNKLYHYEIANLASTAQLAVLSACETGIGKDIEGEGVMSLGRSFMYAGIPSVVMSLWKIEDNSTSELMPLFYKYLKDGQPKSQALRQAKLDYLNNTSQLKAHPFYWSGMIALGENQALKQSNLWSISWIIGIVGVVLLLLFVFFKFRKLN